MITVLFNEHERRVIDRAWQKYMDVLDVIRQLHEPDLTGALSVRVSDDRSGFVVDEIVDESPVDSRWVDPDMRREIRG